MTAQTPIKQFYREYKKAEGVTNIKLPGWLIRLGSGLAYNSVDDPMTQEALQLARKVQQMRLLVSETGGAIPAGAVRQLAFDLKDRHGFEDLLYVRDRDTQVEILTQDQAGTLRELVLLVHEVGGDFVMLSLRSKLTLDDLSHFIRAVMDEHGFNIDLEELSLPSESRAVLENTQCEKI